MSLPRLTEQSPAAAEAVRRRQGALIGIVHFGPGAFFRAHQAWYFHQLLQFDSRCLIAAVSLKSPGVRDALAPQQGLYSLAELDRDSRFEVIGSVAQVLVAPEDPEAVLNLLADPQIHTVTTTVTEKGYCLGEARELDFSHPDITADLAGKPTSLIGYLVEALRRRRAAALPPPVVISCDNLPGNGRLFKAAVVALAARSDPGLAAWIEAEAVFPNTMVDSITPATDDALRTRVADALNITDAWPVQRERFTQWVIEDILPAGAPDLARVGAQLTTDVAGYERAKLRLLNGPHSTLAYMGLLRRRQTVAEAMADPDLAAFVERLMTDDILPTVNPPAGLDAAAYIAAILGRFRNPAIVHTLAQIAWDGSQKLPIRLMGTIRDALAAGRPVDNLTLPIGAWMAFIVRQARAGAPIVDPLNLAEIGLACTGEAEHDLNRFFMAKSVFSSAISGEKRFKTALIDAYRAEFSHLGNS